jgi:hypothetical protein
MTTTSGGNLSIRNENDDIWITPARVDKGSLLSLAVVARVSMTPAVASFQRSSSCSRLCGSHAAKCTKSLEATALMKLLR